MPLMRVFLILLYLIVYLYCGMSLYALATETNKWPSTMGVVTDNTSSERTITYAVKRRTYLTHNENILDLLALRMGGRNTVHPGQSKTLYNGVDPEIGRQVEVFYDPSNPSLAVVTKGWSQPIVIALICFAIPLLIRVFVAYSPGATVSEKEI